MVQQKRLLQSVLMLRSPELQAESAPTAAVAPLPGKVLRLQLCLSVSLIFNSTGDYAVVSYD